jgi:hypothetical protein
MSRLRESLAFIAFAAVMAAGMPTTAMAQAGTEAQARAQAQTRAQQDAAIAALRTSLSAAAHTELVAAVRDARERGLPAQPLIAKAQEGAAKNVPGDRIMAAVRQTSQRLVRAQVLLQARAGGPAGGAPAGAAADATAAAEISAVADALQRGVPENAIARLVADAQDRESVGLTAHALADLLGHGVPLAIGLEAIGAWRGQGGDPARLNDIPAAVERLVRQGVVPARAGAAVAAGLRLGRAPGSIRPVDVPRIIGGG